MPKKLIPIIILMMTFLFFACVQGERKVDVYEPTFEKPQTRDVREFVFGIHPLFSPQKMQDIYGPIMSILSREIPHTRFRLEASQNYDDYNEKLTARKFDFAIPNPYQTILAQQHSYKVIAKMGDDQNFRGIVLVRKDSGIRKLSDLKGKTLSFPAPSALFEAIERHLSGQQSEYEVSQGHRLQADPETPRRRPGSSYCSLHGKYPGRAQYRGAEGDARLKFHSPVQLFDTPAIYPEKSQKSNWPKRRGNSA